MNDEKLEMERYVLSGLLNKPSLIQASLILPEYFSTFQTRNICKTLLELDGNWYDYHEVVIAYNEQWPNSMTEDDWDDLYERFIGVSAYNVYLKKLRLEYAQSVLQDRAHDYEVAPTDENLQSMETAIMDVKEPAEVKTETPEDMAKDLDYELTHDVPEGLKTYSILDDALNSGLRGGNLFVIGARPAVGKSSMALNLLLNAAVCNDHFTGDLFSLEMRNKENRNRMLSHETGMALGKFYNMNKQLKPDEKQKVKDAMQRFTQMGINFYDTFKYPDEIIAKIRERAMAAKHGHYLAIVDYLQLLNLRNGSAESRTNEIAAITRAFKVLTNELDIPIILLSQLNRASTQKQGDDLSDLRESGSIEQDANVVAFLSNVDDAGNTPYKQRVAFNIKKNREGKLANLAFDFYKSIQTFKQAPLF